MLSQIRASFQPKLGQLSEQEQAKRRLVQSAIIPNIAEPGAHMAGHQDDQYKTVAPSESAPYQLYPNTANLPNALSPVSMTNSSLSPVSPGYQSLTPDRPVISPSSSSYRSQTKSIMPAELFIIVRPPPGKQNHPLNLQIQLILPNQPANINNPSREHSLPTSMPPSSSSPPPLHHQSLSGKPISSAPENMEGGGADNPLELNRSQSIRSVHSNKSSRSNRTCSSSGEGRSRRVTPLYNLQWHTVLPTWISDAGTDAKVAKFAKRGIELIDLANIEPSEIRSGQYASDMNLLLSGTPNSPPAQATSFLSTPGSPNVSLGGGGGSGGGGKHDRSGASALFNKVRKLGALNKKTGPRGSPAAAAAGGGSSTAKVKQPSSGGMMMMSSSQGEQRQRCTHHDLPSTNAGLSTVGPAMEAGGRRAEGYVWIVRKWNKPEIVDWQNSGGGSSSKTHQITPVFMEWRKAKKRARGPSRAKMLPEHGSSSESAAAVVAPPAPPPPAPPAAVPQPESVAEQEPQRIPSPTPPSIASESAFKLFTMPAATTMANFFGRFAAKPALVPESEPESLDESEERLTGKESEQMTTRLCDDGEAPPSTQLAKEQQQQQEAVEEEAIVESPDEEEDEEECSDSDPEDSESPWHCEVVVQAADGFQHRVFVAALTPHPHHPKLVAQLAVPWNLEPVTLRPVAFTHHHHHGDDDGHHDDDDDDDAFRLYVDEIKDLVATTCMWLVVKERLGGVGKRRKGDRAWRI
ncbi:hypothetical protein PCANC_06618 [Puccinia coronata f. sp. avenae]|uniref:Uncharacterized protein n=1 Tax=Puccinia coronata f. sp. avenae TaxID=200324 RepID=A0A2N5SZZ9_9BASI|nr:hypothetical protein PCANC_06618 [Puccinia coronata f. sp. avenae]PLW33704.1 hypothetical protein PCASD_10287 [Puccinia coronata f. sp. avenae]